MELAGVAEGELAAGVDAVGAVVAGGAGLAGVAAARRSTRMS